MTLLHERQNEMLNSNPKNMIEITSDQTTCVLYASQSPALSLSEAQTENLVIFSWKPTIGLILCSHICKYAMEYRAWVIWTTFMVLLCWWLRGIMVYFQCMDKKQMDILFNISCSMEESHKDWNETKLSKWWQNFLKVFVVESDEAYVKGRFSVAA